MVCFDADVLSALMRKEPVLAVVRRVADVPSEDQCTTAITLGELHYGARRAGSDRLIDLIQMMVLEAMPVLPFDAAAALAYGELRVELERAGKRLAEPDLRIAAIALARDATLATGNSRHFERVPGLRVEDWLND